MIVIFSGYNQRAVISFLRTLDKNCVSNYSIIAASEKDTILLTTYVNKVKFIRKNKELRLEEILEYIKLLNKESGEELLLVPSTEALNRFLLRYRRFFEERNCIIPLVTESVYEMISDKKSFCECCEKRGLKVPKEVKLEMNNIPLVAKPKKYLANDGRSYAPVIIKSELEYMKFVKQHDEADFMGQEYIWGESFYILFYFERNGEVYKFSQENYAQQPAGKSIVLAVSSDIHLNNSIVDLYEKMFLEMGYYGFVMVELRYKDGDYYMIEANPRFWGPSQLFCDARYNLFEVFLKEYGYIEQCSLDTINYNARYLWSGGILGDILENKECVWYGKGKEQARKYMNEFLTNDVYNKVDTKGIFEKEKLENELIETLRNLYMKESKHSNYQVLSTRLGRVLGEHLEVNSRYEKERMEYISDNIDINNKKILDIGGNTGFFTLESCDLGAQKVDYYEGNQNHAQFVKLASELLGNAQKVDVHPEYYMFEKSDKKYDIIFCLNVVHHLGSDFAEEDNILNAKARMVECVNKMARITKKLVFQMGYNWCGNPKFCLFENGTKKEMEEFVQTKTAECWKIAKIAVAEKNGTEIVYRDITEENNIRKDEMGEFLNRPLFIMESKVYTED